MTHGNNMVVAPQGNDATILTTGPARFWAPFSKGAKQMRLCFFNALRVLNRKAVRTGDVEMHLDAGSGKKGIAIQHQCRAISGQLRQPRRPRFNIVKAWDVGGNPTANSPAGL